MKIKILTACKVIVGMLFGAHVDSFAQSGATYSSSPNGYSASVGITDTYDAGWTHSYVGLNAKRVGGSWVLGTDALGSTPGSGGNNGGSLLLGGITGELRFYSFPTLNPQNTQTFSDAQINATFPQMVIGKTLTKPVYVKIGPMAPSGVHADYALSVDGKFVAKSIYVTASGWADYVFDKDYELQSLPELEAYVKKNKHLPEIPTTCEVEEAGIDMARMNALLLKKVEELTMYVIELNKQMAAMKAATPEK